MGEAQKGSESTRVLSDSRARLSYPPGRPSHISYDQIPTSQSVDYALAEEKHPELKRELTLTCCPLDTQVILPRIRFHVTISEACSKMTEAHAIKYPSLLYAVLCRASIEPRPEDGDPQDGARMQQASISRAEKQESIGFKLNALKHLNRELSNVQVADDHFPLFHAISFLLRIEVSPFALDFDDESSDESTLADNEDYGDDPW